MLYARGALSDPSTDGSIQFGYLVREQRFDASPIFVALQRRRVRARARFRGPTIIGRRVLFVNRREISGGLRADYRNTLLHEMGHVLGLGHSPNDRDVMTPGAGPGAKEGRYQPGEVTSLHMMYAHRSPGNIFPDRDAALSSISTGPRQLQIID